MYLISVGDKYNTTSLPVPFEPKLHKQHYLHGDEIYPKPAISKNSILNNVNMQYMRISSNKRKNRLYNNKYKETAHTSPTTLAHFLNGFLEERPSSCIANLYKIGINKNWMHVFKRKIVIYDP